MMSAQTRRSSVTDPEPPEPPAEVFPFHNVDMPFKSGIPLTLLLELDRNSGDEAALPPFTPRPVLRLDADGMDWSRIEGSDARDEEEDDKDGEAVTRACSSM